MGNAECSKGSGLVDFGDRDYSDRQVIMSELQKGRTKSGVASEFGVRLWTVHKAVYDARKIGVKIPSTSKVRKSA